MDTVVTFTFFEPSDKYSELCLSLLSEAESEITECGGYMVTAEEDGQTVALNEALSSVVEKALYVYGLSGGYYDFTVAPLVALWDIQNAEKPPSEEDIAFTLSLVGSDNLSFGENELYFPKKGMGVDFGSAGKGFAGDRIAEKLKENGVNAGIVNLGGNIRVFGDNPNRADGKFVVGIKDPFGKKQIIASVAVKNTNVITSGAYERFFLYNGKRYHHILNPKTGYPVENGVESVTVICRDGALADILSTALFAAGTEKGMEMLGKLQESDIEIAAIFVLSDGSVKTFNTDNCEVVIK